MPSRSCKDCVAEMMEADPKLSLLTAQYRVGIKGPALHPGPRCDKHHKARQKEAKATARQATIRRQYGLTDAEHAALLVEQRGACAGCGKVPGPKARQLSVDHDHSCCPGRTSCGRCVRGLLCADCNTTLGNFKDNPEQIRRLADYLDDWPAWRIPRDHEAEPEPPRNPPGSVILPLGATHAQVDVMITEVHPDALDHVPGQLRLEIK